MFLVAFTAAGVSACTDGESERLSGTEYRKRAGDHCATLEDASNELRKAQSPDRTGRDVARYLRRAADGLRDLVQSLDGLSPPETFEADADQLVSSLDEYAEGLDGLADRVRPGETLQATFDRHAKLVTRLNGVASRATGLVSRLGLTGCILSS